MNNSGMCTNWTKADGTCSFGPSHCAAWAHPGLLQTTGLLVLQTGLHPRPWTHLVAKVTEAAAVLQPYVLDGLAVVFRTSVPGWDNCSALAVSHPRPYASLREAEAYMSQHPWYNSAEILWQQRTLRELASSFDWAVMDVLQMTMLRPDVRAPFSNRHNYLPGGMHPGDCLHLYPAHPLRWTDLLSNVVQHCFGRSPRGRAP